MTTGGATRALALTAAIVIGVTIAWQRQTATRESPDVRSAPSDPAPATVPAPTTPGQGRVTPASPAANETAGDGPGNDARPQPSVEASPPRHGIEPAPLPDFFRDGLGPAPREPDGSLTEGSPHELQARLDGERRDPGWADKVEWELQNFLALQPFAERLDSTEVLCRASVCRVTATARRAALSDSDEEGWQAMMSSLRYERVANEFSESADVLVFKASQPDRIGFVTYFDRGD